ncbi:hypothetical protein SAMN05444162_4248 [Paenibacillaceae bacterium GAS479]|nr:hypothetical protein SAMN05444162_4248 [Paenibacillaceae bacterium GAS479]
MRLAELTPFQWDRMVVMGPYTSRDMMEELKGVQWTTARTYFGYRMEKKFLLGCEMCNESVNKLVFLKGDRVTADVTLDRWHLDFTGIKAVIREQDPVFAKLSAKEPQVKLMGALNRDER